MENKETGYTTKLIGGTMEQATNREKYIADNIHSATRLFNLLQETESKTITLKVVRAVIVEIHNPRARYAQDYTEIVFQTINGELYRTGAKGILNSFCENWHKAVALFGDEPQTVSFTIAPSTTDGRNYLNYSILPPV